MDKTDAHLRGLRRALQQRRDPARGPGRHGRIARIVGDPEHALAMAIKHHHLSRVRDYSASNSHALPGREPITGSATSYRIRILSNWFSWDPIARALAAEVEWGDRQHAPNDLAKFLLSERPDAWEYDLAKPALSKIITQCPELRAFFSREE